MESQLIILIPLLPLLGFLINGSLALLGRKPTGLVPTIACGFPLLAFLVSLVLIVQLSHTNEARLTQTVFSWLATKEFLIDFSFMIDNLTAVMLLVITGVGSLIHLYSIGYMKGDAGTTRYFAYLNLFLFFMLVLVLGDNLAVLFIGWEGVGLCSYLLIGFWFEDAEKARAGKKAFVVNRIGDFAFIIGLFLILKAFLDNSSGEAISVFSYATLQANSAILAPSAFIICLCLFIGATGKSAQIPLYVWLPDAMAGPTPVSALIHAATMVTAGVYMVARLFFLFGLSEPILQIMAVIGVLTAFIAALIALTQYDIKKVLAYSTVSQLGFMFLALGAGAPHAAIFHVVTHAFFKACLFLCAGSIIHALHHEQDIRKMGGLAREMPMTALAFLASTLAIAGIPPFSGFFSKDEILWNVYLHTPKIVYWLALITAGLTAFYMFRLYMKVFTGPIGKKQPHSLPKIMTVPVVLLAVLAIVGGVIGIPDSIGSNWIQHQLAYLQPSLTEHATDHALEFSLMGLSAGWAIVMSGAAIWLYWKHKTISEQLRLRFAFLYRLMSHKFYVDELYQNMLVKPIHFISKHVLWKGVDEKLVDGFVVHGWTDFAQLGAWLVSRMQSGQISQYLIYIWVGVAALILLVI